MANAKLMTNILPRYYDFIDRVSRQQGKTKREIIEAALALYMRELRKQKISQAYDAMEKDKEYLNEMREMAELGMEYYLTDIDNANKQV
jgi:hypothetical protein